MSQNNFAPKGTTLKQLKDFVDNTGKGWAIVAETEKSVRIERTMLPEKGNCLIAIILLILGIIPGILYLYFSHKPVRIHYLSVREDNDGTLRATGEVNGLYLWQQFLQSLHPSQEK